VHVVSRLRGGADDESDVEDARCLPCSSSSGGDPPVVSARGPPSGFPGVGGSVAAAAPFAAAAVTPRGQRAQHPTGSIRVACPCGWIGHHYQFSCSCSHFAGAGFWAIRTVFGLVLHFSQWSTSRNDGPHTVFRSVLRSGLVSKGGVVIGT
jgi:hypothetical protein